MASDDGKTLPCDVAKIVFSNAPEAPKSCQLYCESDTNEKLTPVDIFEIFLTILVEGMFIKFNPITKDTLKSFDENVILKLSPWLQSLGFDTTVDVLQKENVSDYDKHYCKIILRSDPSWEQYFETHENIVKDYHFIFGGDSPYIHNQKCGLDNMFAIIILNKKVYKIAFKYI